MWYLINEDGERFRTVENEKEAEKAVKNGECVDYVYSNTFYFC